MKDAKTAPNVETFKREVEFIARAISEQRGTTSEERKRLAAAVRDDANTLAMSMKRSAIRSVR